MKLLGSLDNYNKSDAAERVLFYYHLVPPDLLQAILPLHLQNPDVIIQLGKRMTSGINTKKNNNNINDEK